MSSKKRISLSVKLNLLIISIIILVSGGLVLISYRVYSSKISEYFFEQLNNAAQAAKSEIIPDIVEHFWDEINTDDFRKVREEAIAEDDEDIILNWMISRPSLLNLYLSEDKPDDINPYAEIDELYELNDSSINDSLFLEYQTIVWQLEDFEKLFDITSIYIQHNEDGVTYNLIDSDESLLHIGSTEDKNEIFSDYSGDEHFPPTIYHSAFSWLATTFLPLNKTVDRKIPGYIGVDTDMNLIVHQQQMFLVNSGIYTLILTAAAVLISMFLLNRTAINPLKQLSRAASSFAKDDDKLTKEDVIRLPIKSNDEIGDLYQQIRSMQTRIIDYTENLTRITAERERSRTELHTAEEIQRAMLPEKFPAFPDRSEFDLYASMTPARVVGGDFYDFFMPDNNHLAVLIADVSDKGIPAALFMMASKILINYRTRQGGTPAEILTDVNAQICSENSSKMFVTVWMGILDLTDGVMTCTNAGHEYPFLKGAGGSFHMLNDKHGLVVGALTKTKYSDYEVKLEPGDAVFVYTDGVTEANDPNGELYGVKRLETALNRVSKEDPQTILEHVRADVESFVNGAKQFDDLTMLCLKYKKPIIPYSENL